MERGVKRDLQVLGVRRWRELVADREKWEGHCSTGQSPQWAIVPMGDEDVSEQNIGPIFRGQAVFPEVRSLLLHRG